jgi:hypothetical protein
MTANRQSALRVKRLLELAHAVVEHMDEGPDKEVMKGVANLFPPAISLIHDLEVKMRSKEAHSGGVISQPTAVIAA